MATVKFKTGLQSAYDSLAFKDDACLYYITDTQRMYKGNLLMSVGKEATQAAAGLLSAEDKALLDSLLDRLDKKVDIEIESTNGKALIFNESTGGGSKFEGKNGVVAYVGTHDNIGGEIGTQIYVDKANGNESTIIDITQNGAYYTKGTILPGSQRDVEDNEIATKKDIKALGPALHYIGGTELADGETINDALARVVANYKAAHPSYVLKEGAVAIIDADKTVEYIYDGTKWQEFGAEGIYETKAEAQAAYDALNAAIGSEEVRAKAAEQALDDAKQDNLTAGSGITLVNNVVGYDEEVIASVEYVDANISDTMNFIIQERDTEKAARQAGDELLQGKIEAEEARAKAAEATKTTEHISGTNGESYIWNEQSGGGARFENKNGVQSFVGVNDGANGVVAQIYADKLVDGKWQGAKLDVANGGMYYTVGNQSAAERMVAENEIATKGDIEAAALVWENI